MAGITLQDDWVENMTASLQGRELPADVSFAVVVQITGAADGDVSAAWRAANGWLAPAADVTDPELIVLAAAKDAVGVIDGSVPLPVGFMRGKVKITGDPKLAVALLKASTKAP